MKRTLRMLTIVPLAMLAVSSSVYAQHAGQPLPSHQQLSRLGLERAWWAQAVMNPNRDKIQHVVVDEDTVYVQTSSGLMTAFDGEIGRQKWTVRLGKYDQPSSKPISNEEETMVAVGSTIYGMDKSTGRILWTLPLEKEAVTGATADENRLYFGTMEGSVYAYDLKKIRRLYAQRRLPEFALEARIWRYNTGKEITSAPIVGGQFIDFASRNGSLYALRAEDRKLVFQFETDKPIVAPVARMDETLFVASEDNSFIALNMFNGQVRWEFTSGLPIRKPIWTIGNDLYVLPARGGLFSLDPATGLRRWANPYLTSFISVQGNTVAALDEEGNMVVLTRDKGTVIGRLPVQQFALRVGNDRTDRIVLATENGLILCLRPLGQPYPVFHRCPDRLPLLPEFFSDEESKPQSDEAAPAKEEGEMQESTEESNEPAA